MSEGLTKARCAVCSWPLFVHPGRAPCVAPVLHLPIAGVRVDGNKVIVSVRGGNDAARSVCGALIAMLPINQERGQAGALGHTAMTQAASDVLAERQRQISTECWTPEHDDQHWDGSLAAAAACYANPMPKYRDPRITDLQGWPGNWTYKPKGRRLDLVRAGALILAELERIDRAAATAAIAKPAQASTCSYPDCHCPFDAPGDPNWCARGLAPRPRMNGSSISGNNQTKEA